MKIRRLFITLYSNNILYWSWSLETWIHFQLHSKYSLYQIGFWTLHQRLKPLSEFPQSALQAHKPPNSCPPYRCESSRMNELLGEDYDQLHRGPIKFQGIPRKPLLLRSGPEGTVGLKIQCSAIMCKAYSPARECWTAKNDRWTIYPMITSYLIRMHVSKTGSGVYFIIIHKLTHLADYVSLKLAAVVDDALHCRFKSTTCSLTDLWCQYALYLRPSIDPWSLVDQFHDPISKSTWSSKCKCSLVSSTLSFVGHDVFCKRTYSRIQFWDLTTINFSYFLIKLHLGRKKKSEGNAIRLIN